MTVLAVLALGCAVAKINHPSLLFTPQKVEEAMRRVHTDTVQANAFRSIINKADQLLCKTDVRQMEYLALAYQLTGENKYADKLRVMLLDISKTDSWTDSEMMQRNPPWHSELQIIFNKFRRQPQKCHRRVIDAPRIRYGSE